MAKRIKLASEEYAAQLKQLINDDKEYAQLAATVDDSYTLVLQAEPPKGVNETVTVGFVIKSGKMTDVWLGERQTSFILSAPYSVWVDILLGKIGPNRAFITRRLKIVGNMPRLLKTAKATERLVDLLRKVPTEFHGEYAKLSFG